MVGDGRKLMGGWDKEKTCRLLVSSGPSDPGAFLACVVAPVGLGGRYSLSNLIVPGGFGWFRGPALM